MADPITANVARVVAGRLAKSLQTKTGRRRLWRNSKWTAILVLMALIGAYFYAPDKVRELVMGYLAEKGVDTSRIEEVTQGGPIRAYFTRPNATIGIGGPAHELSGIIDRAQQTIDAAGFEVDNQVIVQALIRAVQRGVKVRLVTDTDYIDESGPQSLKAAGVPIVEDRRSAFMHNKFMVFDGKAVWTGSMNFTENCAYRNNNHGIYLEVPQLAENYTTKFRWMFEDKIFGKAKPFSRIPHPIIKLPDGTVIENYFSTHDHLADHIMRTLAETQQSIDFLAFSFTHDGIAKVMIDKSRKGVAVRGVFEKTQTSSGHAEYTAMRALGLPVYLDTNPRNMHHKVIVIDGMTTVCGSFNFSENADKSNDENILIIRNNPAIGHLFEEEFSRVYDAAQAAK